MQTPIPALGIELPTGTEIYDSFMSQIEPELVSANLPILDQKYVDEGSDDRKKRYERYQKAFQQYDQAYLEWSQKISHAYSLLKKKLYKQAEKKATQNEVVQMTHLDTAINNSELPQS